jgi:hypothetical protein
MEATGSLRSPVAFYFMAPQLAQYAALVELAANYFAAGYEFYTPIALRLDDQAALRTRFGNGE